MPKISPSSACVRPQAMRALVRSSPKESRSSVPKESRRPSLRSSYSEISRFRSSIYIRSASITAEATSSRSAERWTGESFCSSASSSECCSLLYLYSLSLRIMPLSPPRLLSGGVVGSGQETHVEGEGLWLAAYDGGEVGVGRVQEVVAFALYDDARNLEHGASLAPDPFVT